MGGRRAVTAFAPDIHLKVARDRSGVVDGGMTLDAGLRTGVLGVCSRVKKEDRQCQKRGRFEWPPDSRDAAGLGTHNKFKA
jgi:hypothetical protein